MKYVTITDDGKGRWQSFEAESQISHYDTDYYCVLELHSYGEDENEAKNNLKKSIEVVKSYLNEIEKDLNE